MKPLLSCIFVADELPCLDFLPWRESLASVLRVADEVIVVHGGKAGPGGRRQVEEHVRALRDERVRFLVFPWPEAFDWRQIARACTFGQLHANGPWCCRVLADEIFPDAFADIGAALRNAPPEVRIVSVARLYLLGDRYACPFHGKPLFFRNDRSLGYGTVNPAQGDAASYLLFDDPLETDRWFDGQQVVSIERESLLRDPQAVVRLQAGEAPRGYRGESTDRMTLTLPLGILNVDVNHFSDEALLDQKELSQAGYQRLPPEYPHRAVLSRAAIGAALEKKIRGMIRSGPLLRVAVPEPLRVFMDERDRVSNRVRRICESEAGLPWNRVSAGASRVRRARTLARVTLRRLGRRGRQA